MSDPRATGQGLHAGDAVWRPHSAQHCMSAETGASCWPRARVRGVPGRASLLGQVGAEWVTLRKLRGELLCRRRDPFPTTHAHWGISQSQVKARSEMGAFPFTQNVMISPVITFKHPSVNRWLQKKKKIIILPQGFKSKMKKAHI